MYYIINYYLIITHKTFIKINYIKDKIIEYYLAIKKYYIYTSNKKKGDYTLKDISLIN